MAASSKPVIERKKIRDLTPDPSNANAGTERGLSMLDDSLSVVGLGRSIVTDKHGIIIGGNKTTERALDRGFENAIVVHTHGDELVVVQRDDLDLRDPDPNNAARRMAYYDNRVAQVDLDWNAEQLLADVNAGFDFEHLFSDGEMAALLADVSSPDVGTDAGAQVDRAAELQQKWQTERGQLWRIGKHRLLCGDSTSAEDVARLMDGERARIVVTSPPYADQRDYEIGEFDWHALMCGVFDALITVVGNPCDVLINLGMSHKDGRVNRYYDKWLDHCEQLGYPLYGWYVWDKGSGFPGEWNGRLAPAHEFVFHFSIGRESARKWIKTTGESAKRGSGGKRFRQKDGSMKEVYSPDAIGQPFKVPDSVIRITREMARGIHTQSHPAVYPVEFASFLVETWSEKDNIVLEPFGGSGTTMVACEQLGRQCRTMELEPKYCAVILERMSAMGITPELQA